MTKQRFTNIELARIISMLGIIMSHLVVHGGIVNIETCINKYLGMFFIPLGKSFFILFLVISTYFLENQFKISKFVRLWLEVYFYSIVCYVLTIKIGGGTVSLKTLIFSNLPIVGNTHGFASTYLAFYLISPFLYKIYEKLSEKQLYFITLILIYLNVISKIIYAFNNYYPNLVNNELGLFITIYFVTKSLKHSKFRPNRWIVFLSLLIMYAVMVGVYINNFIIGSSNFIYKILNVLINDESSIGYLAFGYMLFYMIIKVKVPNLKIINKLASFSLAILVIHDNNFFRYIFWTRIIKTQEWYYSDYFLIKSIIVACLIYVCCSCIEYFRQVIEKIIFNTSPVKRLLVKSETCFKESVRKY